MRESSPALRKRLSSWGLLATSALWRKPAVVQAAEDPGSPWLAAMAAVASELRQLNRATEADFLAVGSMLTDFLTRAHQMSSDTSAMSESISGAAGQVACDSLEAILRHAKSMQENANATNNRLLEVRRLASRIGEEFSGFQQTVSSFQLVATLARIETERLGASDSELGNLTEEFRSHAAHVVEGVAQVLEDVSTVKTKITSTAAGISALQEQKLTRLPASIRGIEANLAAFRERQQTAAATTGALASQVRELSTAVAEIVNSIQFHDITRQQIEHVEEILTESHDRAALHPPTPMPSRREALILALQCDQMDAATQAFSKSVSAMDHQLQSISAQVKQMTVAQQALLELHGGHGESYFLEFKSSFDSIIEAIGDCEVMESSVRAAMIDLNAVVDRLNQSSRNIRMITIQLKWLALNACVSAVKLGTLGEPLNIVSQSMQSLQASCETNCLETEATIDSIHKVLAVPTDESGAAARSGGEIRADVSARIAELHSSSQATTASWRRVSDTAEAFATDIQAAQDRLSVGTRVTDAIQSCQRQIGALLGTAIPISAEESELFRDDFQQLARRYTMKEERAIQQRFLGDMPPQTAEELILVEQTPSDSSEFGDNVDLF